MSDYMKSYNDRLDRNDKRLRQLTETLKEQGCVVYHPRSKRINFIKVFLGEQHISMAFSEVPYRWTLYANIVPNKKSGSSYEVTESRNMEMGFSVYEILSNMQPYPFPTKIADLDKNLTYLKRA